MSQDVLSVRARSFAGSKDQGRGVHATKVAIPIQLSAKPELTEREMTRITDGLPTSAIRGPHARVVLSTMVQRRKFNGGLKMVTQNTLQGNSPGIVTRVLPPWSAASVALTSAHRQMSESDMGPLCCWVIPLHRWL